MNDNEPFSELLKQCMNARGRDQAAILFRRMVAHYERQGMDNDLAVSRTKEQIGYHAGYYSNNIRSRVETLFDTEHPIFGCYIINGSPTISQALEAGKSLGAGRSMAEIREELGVKTWEEYGQTT